jgi:hypothetical protein
MSKEVLEALIFSAIVLNKLTIRRCILFCTLSRLMQQGYDFNSLPVSGKECSKQIQSNIYMSDWVSLTLQVHSMLLRHKPHSEQEGSYYVPSVRRNRCKRYYHWEDNNRHQINLAMFNNIGPPNVSRLVKAGLFWGIYAFWKKRRGTSL